MQETLSYYKLIELYLNHRYLSSKCIPEQDNVSPKWSTRICTSNCKTSWIVTNSCYTIMSSQPSNQCLLAWESFVAFFRWNQAKNEWLCVWLFAADLIVVSHHVLPQGKVFFAFGTIVVLSF